MNIRVNFFKTLIKFLKDAYYELTKVTWLSKKEVVIVTLTVVVFIVIASIFVSIVDLILNAIVGIVL
ncbi:MAG: preprotein translocase subunit SecE [Endomicrobium sp.]|nr:preprotein translocase subunit SecE [Endomicrobium sp.]